MPPDNDGSWARAGEMLAQRRVELDPRYRNKRTFAAERGVNWRLVYDIENAKRTNYEPDTLRAIEVAYGLAPGNLDRILAAGEIETVSASRSQEPQRAETGGMADPAAVLFPTDPVAQDIWRRDISEAEKVSELAGWRQVQADGFTDEVVTAIWLQFKPAEIRLAEIEEWRGIQERRNQQQRRAR